jgi:alpha-1,2-mannosyltransferase
MGFCLLGLIVHFTITVHRVGNKIGDFDVHRDFGRAFLAGEYLYQGGQCFNYMPITAMFRAPLALVPPRVAMAGRYLVALVCLGLTLRFLHEMVFAARHMEGRKSFLIALLTLLFAGHYLLRDLDDGGPHLILLAILVGGIYCVWQGRQKIGAMWLGLAIAVKMTPGLFLPFLLWKRQGRLAAYTSLATLGWTVLPAAWMGPASWWHHQQEWNQVAFSVFRDQPDSGRDDNELRVQNQSLKPAVMRFLAAHPPGHPLRLDHAGYYDFLNLKQATASRVANLALLALGCAFCWKTRKTYCPRHQADWLAECATLLLLMLLLSPLTWLQHVVWAVPAIYLIVAASQKGLTPLTVSTMTIYVVLSLVLNRELLGRANYLLLLSYHAHTVCMLLLLLLCLRVRQASAAAGGEMILPMSRPESSVKRRAA